MEFSPRNQENTLDEGTEGQPSRKKRMYERGRTQRNSGSAVRSSQEEEKAPRVYTPVADPKSVEEKAPRVYTPVADPKSVEGIPVSPWREKNGRGTILVPPPAPAPPSTPPVSPDPFRPLQKTVAVDPVKIFYCSTPKDKKLQEQLVTHLTTLKRWKQITLWLNDLSNRPGEISIANSPLQEADLILLLITPDLIASRTDYQRVLDALQRHYIEGTAVIPVLLRPTVLPPEIQPFEILPKNGRSLRAAFVEERPLTLQRSRDAAFVEVVTGIGEVVNALFASKPQNAPLLPADQEEPSVFARMRGSSCAHCGTRNPLGPIYCKKCGDLLLNVEKDTQIIYSPDTYIDDVTMIPSFLKTILPDLRKTSAQMTEEEWIKKGNWYREHQQYLQAIAAYTCAIFLESQSIPAYLNRCLAYFQIHQMHHACADSGHAYRLICQALRSGTEALRNSKTLT